MSNSGCNDPRGQVPGQTAVPGARACRARRARRRRFRRYRRAPRPPSTSSGCWSWAAGTAPSCSSSASATDPGSRCTASTANMRDGNADILSRNGLERGLIARRMPPDASAPDHHVWRRRRRACPSTTRSFDIVYSQVAWRYFGNKVGVLREVSRVLRDDGLAKIDAEELRPDLPPEYRRLVEIWDEGRLVPFGDYLRRFGMAFAPCVEGEYLRFGKAPRLRRRPAIESSRSTSASSVHTGTASMRLSPRRDDSSSALVESDDELRIVTITANEPDRNVPPN